MLQIKFTNKMKRDVKRMLKRGKNIAALETVLDLLTKRKPLNPKYRDHPLQGNEKGFRECHIDPDWLLKYQVRENELILLAVETGSHADLFGL